ncbi:MAG TPA: lytic transglycosylase domain-containing protein [Terriglobales bacterium]|nr:lytic transglycosylase domain-containing protein [Terriglobales bacterium]
MRKSLKIALMAATALAISFSSHRLKAETVASEDAAAPAIATTEENGRKVYVNDYVAPPKPVRRKRPAPVNDQGLLYWSVTEHRYKPVPPASGSLMQAARSAAAEVRSYLNAGTHRNRYSNAPRFFVSSEQVDSAIEEAAARHDVDPNLVRAVVKVESNFNAHAVSAKGAMGLMQLMPATARELNVSNPFDPQQNVDAGVRHLKHLLNNYNGDIRLTLAAYNAGQGAVERHGGVPRFRETQDYVKRITNLYWHGSSQGLLGGPRHDPVHMFRDAQGVLTITNTD